MQYAYVKLQLCCELHSATVFFVNVIFLQRGKCVVLRAQDMEKEKIKSGGKGNDEIIKQSDLFYECKERPKS